VGVGDRVDRQRPVGKAHDLSADVMAREDRVDAGSQPCLVTANGGELGRGGRERQHGRLR
jgi:hypothetical protein